LSYAKNIDKEVGSVRESLETSCEAKEKVIEKKNK